MKFALHKLLSAVIAVLSIGQAAAASVQGQEEGSLKIAIVSRTVFYAPLWLAHKNGYFQDEGIKADIEVFDNADRITESLKSGSTHIAISTPEGAILDSLRGGPLRIIAGNAKKLPHFVIAKPSIKTPHDLRGANFGVLSLNEGTTYLVREYARSVGLTPDDYRISQVGGAPTRWRLLKEGKIDAGLQPFPLSYEAEQAGFTNLGPISKIVPDWQFTSINVVNTWAQDNRTTVEKFLRAMKRGHAEMERNPDAAAVIAKELNTSTALAARALADTKALDILSGDLRFSRPGLERVFESLKETGQVEKGVTFRLEDVVDESFLATAFAPQKANR